MKNWSPADAEKELNALKKLACSDDFGGMGDFSEERSHILRMAYQCMDKQNKIFGECQKDAWSRYRNAVKDCIE